MSDFELSQEPKENIIMIIGDVFTISGRGTVVTGQLRSRVKVGESVEIVGNEKKITAIVASIESLNKLLLEAFEGDNVGLVLRGINKNQVERGFYIQKEMSNQSIISELNTTIVQDQKNENPDQNLCPNCGTELEPDENFCCGCGMPITVEQPVSSQEAQVENSIKTEPARIPCANCGKEIQADWAVCPYCKADVVHEILCRSCGKKLQPDWQICPFCKEEAGSN